MDKLTDTSSPYTPPLRRRRTRFILFAGVIFLCGMITGATGAAWLISSRVQHWITNPEIIPERVTAFLQRRLDLDEEQREKVLEILERRLENVRAIRSEIKPRLEKELSGVQTEINDLLTPKQAQQWNERFEKMKTLLLPSQK